MANTRVVALTVPAAGVSASLSDFPVLLTRANFPDELFDPAGANSARTDGGDLRFYTDSAGTTEIPREIVAFEHDTSLGADDAVIQVWVKVPSLSSATDTTIYCQYGDGTLTDYAATDPYGRNAVWAAFEAVLHLSDSGYVDSTGNGYDGVANSAPTQTTADNPYGGIWTNFDGSDDYLQLTGSSAIVDASEFTISAWSHKDSTSTDSGIVSNRRSAGTSTWFQFSRHSFSTMIVQTAAGGNISGSVGDVAGTAMSHMVASASALVQYRDGAAVDTDTTIVGSNQITGGANTTVGTYYDLSSSRCFGGKIGEVRITKQALSADWIATEYNNQSNPAGFITVGTPTDVGGGGGELVSESLTEALSFSDTLMGRLTAQEALTQSLSLGQTLGPRLVVQEAVTEALSFGADDVNRITAQEALAQALALDVSNASSIKAVESLLVGFGLGLSLGDGSQQTVSESLTEALSFGASVSNISRVGESLAVSIELTPALAQHPIIREALTQGMSLGESLSTRQVATVSLLVPLVFGDTAETRLSVQEALTLGITLGQAVTLPALTVPPGSRTITVQAQGRAITVQQQTRTRTVQ